MKRQTAWALCMFFACSISIARHYGYDLYAEPYFAASFIILAMGDES